MKLTEDLDAFGITAEVQIVIIFGRELSQTRKTGEGMDCLTNLYRRYPIKSVIEQMSE